MDQTEECPPKRALQSSRVGALWMPQAYGNQAFYKHLTESCYGAAVVGAAVMSPDMGSLARQSR